MQCARRELLEETGIDIPEKDFVFLKAYNVIIKEKGYHYVEIDMAAKMPENQ